MCPAINNNFYNPVSQHEFPSISLITTQITRIPLFSLLVAGTFRRLFFQVVDDFSKIYENPYPVNGTFQDGKLKRRCVQSDFSSCEF